jgi:ketosteroid isomerase-like protein
MADNREIIREFYERVFNGRELDRIGEYWADPELVERVTRGCLTYYDAFPDLHISVEELIAEGDRVFVRTTVTGTHDGEYKGIAPTGRNVAAECAEVYRLEDGKIVGYWCLLDVAGMMRQLTEEPAATRV